MRRICIDARCLADSSSGGVTRMALYFIRQYIKDNPDAKFIMVTTGLYPSAIVKKISSEINADYLHIKIPNKIFTAGNLLNLLSLTQQSAQRLGKIDRLLLPNLAYTGKINCPFDLLLHDFSFIIEPRWFSFRRRWWHKLLPVAQLIRQADKCYCVSEQTKRDLNRIYKKNAKTVKVIDFLPDDLGQTSIQPNWLPKNAARLALLLGGSDARKNIRTALTAIINFNLKYPDKYLTPIVIGGRVSYKNSVFKPGYVLAPKYITAAELNYLYKYSTVLLYPSWYEGFGLPPHEAHFFNTPVISSTAGALPDTAPTNTILCHPGKPHEWLMALEQL